MKKHELRPATERCGVAAEQNAAYVEKLSRMINCKTVWTHEGTNEAEFLRFYSVIEELFPNIAKRAKRLTFGGGCFFYVIEGKNAKKNILLMSHHDVVDGGEGWDTDPFTLTEKDGIYTLGVHIADVTHYVKENSSLDREAYLVMAKLTAILRAITI